MMRLMDGKRLKARRHGDARKSIESICRRMRCAEIERKRKEEERENREEPFKKKESTTYYQEDTTYYVQNTNDNRSRRDNWKQRAM